MRNATDIEWDPAWLRLPIAKRDLAFARLQAMTEFESSPRHVDDAKRTAMQLGISVRQFYFLFGEWKANDRSIWTLVPHVSGKSGRRSKLRPEVERHLHQEIRRTIEELGLHTPRAILAAIRENWPSDLSLPQEATLRAHIEAAGGLDIIEKGPFTLNASLSPQENAESASTHGEVIVIDHTAPEIFIAGEAARRPTLTLAIDLFTATIVGYFVSVDRPNAKSVLAAIDDAEARTQGNSGHRIRPRLVLAVTNGLEWRDLLAELEQRGLETTVRWGSRLHRGGPTKRLIGSRIGPVPLMVRKTHERSLKTDVFKPAKHALVTLDQANIVLEDAISDLNADRATLGVALNRLNCGGRHGVY